VEIFVYGTLTEHSTAASVLEEFRYEGRAVLEGLHRVEGRYPTLLPGGEVEGQLLVTEDVHALDGYEGVDDGLYARVSLPADGDRELPGGEEPAPAGDEAGSEGEKAVQTYVGNPARLGVADEWPGEGPFASRVRAYVNENQILVRKTDE